MCCVTSLLTELYWQVIDHDTLTVIFLWFLQLACQLKPDLSQFVFSVLSTLSSICSSLDQTYLIPNVLGIIFISNIFYYLHYIPNRKILWLSFCMILISKNVMKMSRWKHFQLTALSDPWLKLCICVTASNVDLDGCGGEFPLSPTLRLSVEATSCLAPKQISPISFLVSLRKRELMMEMMTGL